MAGTEQQKGAVFSSDWRRFEDSATGEMVFRLTDPAFSSTLPAHYNRAISRGNTWLLFASDRAGRAEAFRMDLKSGQTTRLTAAADLDGYSLALLPDDRSFCFLAGRRLCLSTLPKLVERTLYTIPTEWQPCRGVSIASDGRAFFFGERRDNLSRLRTAPLAPGAARTVAEAPFEISDPIARPLRAQVLYRQGDSALWLVNTDGRENRKLALASGRVGPAYWAADGKSVFYLNYSDEPARLNTIREYIPESNEDRMVAKTSQYAQFAFNRNASVFAGASRNAAAPAIMLLLRTNRRERMLCEHRSSQPETVAPFFATDAQCVYFQSDRHGKPAIYCVPVRELVEKTEESAK